MKKLIQHIFDKLTPADIDAVMQPEEQARARMLVSVQLLAVLITSASCLASLVLMNIFPALLNWKVSAMLAWGVAGYSTSLLLYRSTGWNILCSNLLAVSFYTTIVPILLILPHDMQSGLMLHLLALPLLVTIIGNYHSAIFWVVMVAVAPVVIDSFGAHDFTPFFLMNWVALSLGLFVALYGSNIYLSHFSQRLHLERASFEFAAGHDPLTGLMNRATFDRRLQENISLCMSDGHKSVLAFIDLDKFKPINDSLGHHAGDAVLVEIAERLRNLVRRSDSVARLGGDEFAILFDHADPDVVEPIIDRIIAVVSMPMEVAGTTINVGCSLGVVVCPDDGFDPKQLAQLADEQMYASKRGKAISGESSER